MFVVDTNVLIYAVHRGSRQHGAAREWLTRALAGPEVVGLPWTVLLGFLRITTNPRVFPYPLTVEGATEIMNTWLAHPGATVVEPTQRHAAILTGLLVQSGAAGNLTADAHVAALAIEHGASVASFDRDFARFGVPVVVPKS